MSQYGRKDLSLLLFPHNFIHALVVLPKPPRALPNQPETC